MTRSDDDLISAFESCALPFEEWTHRAHVRVAFIALRRWGWERGVDFLRAGIQRYNAANDVPEGPKSGYNETTTVAFARLIHAVMTAYEPAFPAPDSETFCETHPQLMHKHVLRFFYSPERRLHPDAKTTFVEPDLAPLPRPENARP